MPLASGVRLGPYELAGLVGSGGMGDVYRARDSRLNRTVAIKVVQGEFTERFEREAKAISALNHPHICTLYDIGSEGGVQYLVLEFVEGETLADRLRKGALPREQAIHLAVEIASALDAAHRKGIAHRDLKPGNVMLTKSGVKLLDFGLAKMVAPTQATEAGATVSMAAAVTARHTVLGTPQYMAPEQVEGREADTRADIFAFGCVLYEMLSGQRAFEGKSVSSIMAAILEREPPLLATAGTPFDWVVRRCLEKDPDARFQSIHDVRLQLDRPSVAKTPPVRPWRETAAWTLAALSVIALGVFWWKLRPAPAASPSEFTRLTYDAGVTSRPDISPDGKFVVYASDRDDQKNLDLYLQQIPSGNPVRLTSTDEDENEPAFSPDGASIAFSSTRNGGGIYIMPALGGEPRLLVRGGHWPKFSPDGSSIAYCTSPFSTGDPFAASSSRSFVIPVGGGVPLQIAPEFQAVREPLWSPDGKRILFLGQAPGDSPVANRRGYWVVPVEGGKPVRSDFALAEGLIASWKQDGLYFVKYDDALNRVSNPHDARSIYRLAVDAQGRRSGAPVQLTVGASRDAWPAISREGRMVFANGSEHVNLWAVPIDGNAGKVTGEPYRISASLAPQSHPVLSPDGRKLLFDSTRSGITQVWQHDLTTGKEALLVTQAGSSPTGGFMPISGRIAYRVRDTRRGGFDTYILDPATGESRKVYEDGYFWSINPSETLALGRTPSGTLAGVDGYDLKSGERFPMLRGDSDQSNLYQPFFSPDERWIVFLAKRSDDKGRVFVVPTKSSRPVPKAEWLPVTDDSLVTDKPRFSPDGRLIYFTLDRENSRSIHAVRFDTETGKPQGTPFLVYDFPGPRRSIFLVNTGQLEISVVRDKLVTVLSEANWNIWMTDLRAR